MNEEEWSGLERRTADSLGKFKTMLNEHTKEEMERYAQIIDGQANLTDKINSNNQMSEDRHDETQERISHLTQSIEAFIEGNQTFMDSIKRAFPRDDEGKPDYDGHRGAHLAWISDAKAGKELKEYIKKVVMASAAIALSSWIVLLVWNGVLHGPVAK